MKFITSLIGRNSKIALGPDVNGHAEKGILAKKLKKIGLKSVCAKMFK